MPFFQHIYSHLLLDYLVLQPAVSASREDINATGVICGLEDGYDYGYSFTNEEVLRHTFIVSDDKILPNIKPLGPFTNKSDYIEWNVHFSNTTFWFQLNLATLILTTQSEEANLNFNHQCEIYELTQWNRKLSELENLYQSEYDKYLEFIYNKGFKQSNL